MSKKIVYRILGIIFILLLIAQLIGIDRSVPESDPQNDFMNHEIVPDPLSNIIKSACYDCHSYQTRYPWYSYVAPVSWWLQGHIDHAREHLNFSIWGTYDTETQEHKLEECNEEVSEGYMPLLSYTWIHADARLAEDQREKLANWFGEMYKNR
jgi:hypothetical protein